MAVGERIQFFRKLRGMTQKLSLIHILGLNRREANEFIVYWLPHMEGNAYNLIAFQTSSYTDHARLTADPAPDTVLRVFMAWKPLDLSLIHIWKISCANGGDSGIMSMEIKCIHSRRD